MRCGGRVWLSRGADVDGRVALAVGGPAPDQARRGSQSAGVRWPAAGRYSPDLAALRGWAAHLGPYYPVLGMELSAAARQGKKTLLIVWDNASWHISREVRQWVRAHNR